MAHQVNHEAGRPLHGVSSRISPSEGESAAQRVAHDGARKGGGRTNLSVAGDDPSPDAAARWAREARFFDQRADALGEVRPLPIEVRRRYVDQPRRIYEKEFRFRLAGDLHGMHVLDLGCGEGTNAALLGHRGARVDGIDVSGRLIDVARRRAAIEGLQSQLQFECAPVEQVAFPPDTFDVIWGDGVLHHLIDVLEPTLTQLMGWAKPGALFVFAEPVNMSPWLRRVRGALPIHADATPDERPLQKRDVELLRRFIPELRVRQFHLLSWFDAWVVPRADYERATRWRRGVSDALHAVDFAALGQPQIAPLGGMAVL